MHARLQFVTAGSNGLSIIFRREKFVMNKKYLGSTLMALGIC
jgi:hypothetical protein